MANIELLTSCSRHTFTITNNGKQAESFKISHIPAGTALSLQPVSSRIYMCNHLY